MKFKNLTTILLSFSSLCAFSQAFTIEPSSSKLKLNELSINSDGSVAKAKLHIKGVGLQPTITQVSSAVYTSITTEAIPTSTNNEVYSMYGYATNSSLQNAAFMGHVGNTALMNVGLFGLAQDDGNGDNFGVKTYAANSGNGGAFGVFGSVYGATVTKPIYGIYGEAYGSATKYAGYFDGNVTVLGVFTNISDKNYKKNITGLESCIGKLMKLQPSAYEYTASELPMMALPAGKHYGFLAQDLSLLFPELVSKNIHPAKYDAISHKKISEEKEYLSINYVEMIPLLVKAIQEQQTHIERLEKEIETLRGK